MMKQIFIKLMSPILLLFVFSGSVCAQSVKYKVIKRDSAYYIVATVQSEDTKFLKESTMMLKTFDGNILKLEGSLVDNDSESVGIVIENIVIPVTEINSTAIFKVTPEQIYQFEKGIAKIRLSTIPKEYERTFKKDKIGKKMYESYLKAKEKDDTF